MVPKSETAPEGNGDKDKPKQDVPELSEEDKLLQEELLASVEKLKGADASLWKSALEHLRSTIRESTSSMTSVPKPLKLLRLQYDTFRDEIFPRMTPAANKSYCADIISVLAMVCCPESSNECLKYRLLGSQEEMGAWGHEYVRRLAAELINEWNTNGSNEILLDFVKQIITYFMAHNVEADACDLLMEVERLDLLLSYCDSETFPRVSCVKYTAEPDNTNLLKCAYSIYRHFDRLPEALRLAMCLNDVDLIKDTVLAADDTLRKQLAFMLGRQQIFLEFEDLIIDDEEAVVELTEIVSNGRLNSNFLSLARELDIMEPKVPEDIYKSHLEPNRFFSGTQPDSARQNLAASFVNGFVNCAFGQDKLLLGEDAASNKWIYKNKEHGMLSATASFGCLLLWDVDGGLTKIDKFLYATNDWVKGGALLACGLVNSGVRNECDPALALLSDYVLHASPQLRLGSCLGLGLAYSGSNREDIISILTPVLSDEKSSMEAIGIAALSLGLVSVGKCNGEVSSVILQTLMDRSPADFASPFAFCLPLSLGLTYLGLQESADATIAALEVIHESYRQVSSLLVEICAYAGTGNVLKIQKLLHICSEHFDESVDEKKDKKSDDKKGKDDAKDDVKVDSTEHQAIATLGIALIAMGEEIGAEMAFRSFGNLLRYGEQTIRKAVPLALALLSPSNPQIPILDTLSKFSHDSDAEVSANSIFAMGILGAGTNNARLATMLRQLAVYYSKDASNLFMTRIAQGLTHLGKGTLTINPYHSDRFLMNNVALGGLLAAVCAGLHVKETILGHAHYLLYTLIGSVQPRMLVTVDEALEPLPVAVRVGQAVDVVGQAGKPKTITGFQTHTTPVLLALNERAELATDEYLPSTSFLEGFVILKKNPDYKK